MQLSSGRFVPSPAPILTAILLIGLILRLCWALHLPAQRSSLTALPDQLEYLSIGENVLAGNGFVFQDARFGDFVRAYRMPGYPAFVAMCGVNIRAVRIVQAIIDTSSILAVFLLARRFGFCEAILAAIFVAMNPFLIYFSGLILSETIFCAILVWGMMLIISPIFVRRFIGTILLSGSVLVRPSALGICLILILIAPAGNFTPRRTYHWRALAARGTAALICTFLILLPWAIRNHRILGRSIWSTTNEGITAYDGFHAGATGASDQRFISAMPQLQMMGEIERSDYLKDLAMNYVQDHPLDAIRLAVVKAARMWSPIPLSEQFGRDPKLVAIALAYSLPMFVLIIASIFKGSLPGRAKIFLLAPAIYFTFVHAVSVGSLRYRLPADLPMAVVAASGACALIRSFRLVGWN